MRFLESKFVRGSTILPEFVFMLIARKQIGVLSIVASSVKPHRADKSMMVDGIEFVSFPATIDSSCRLLRCKPHGTHVAPRSLSNYGGKAKKELHNFLIGS